jgi:hypothetical protein
VIQEQLLVLVVADDLRDDVIDALMALPAISGFNLSPIAGYSREHSQFNLREQVEGHRKMSRFEILHDQEQEQELLSILGAVCAESHGRYWIMPLAASGRLGGRYPGQFD